MSKITRPARILPVNNNAHPIDSVWYARFHDFQSYYHPSDKELLWTGDIIQLGNRYAVVITPNCDLAQKKAHFLKFAVACKVDSNADTQEEAFRLVKSRSSSNPKPFLTNGQITESAKGFLDVLGGKESNFVNCFYLLRYIKSEDDHFHLIVDLQNIVTYSMKMQKQWRRNRICRIDSPYLEDLLQSYASLASRIGIPSVSDKIYQAESVRLNPNQQGR
jgi:hypothetical protein